MTIPKWLLPTLSIVAALAVGVALFLVGNRFAAPETIYKAVGTKVVPVLEPAASGVTPDQAKSLRDSGKLGLSPVSGLSTVSTVAHSPSSAGIQEEVQQVASEGGSPNGSTPAPTPTPIGTTYHLIPAPTPTTPPAADPCAPVDTKIPIGCPPGLHSHIYADTAPHYFDLTLTPYASECGTTPTRNARNTATNVPVLIETSAPATMRINYTAYNPNPDEPGQIPIESQNLVLPTLSTDPTQAAAWQSAFAATSPLPRLHSCITLSDRWTSGSIELDVLATSAFGQTTERFAWMDSAGVPVPQGVRVQTFGTSDLVAYVDYPANQRAQILAYDLPVGTTGSCTSVTGLHSHLSVYSTGGPNNPIASNEPSDYVKRESIGFQVNPGTSTLICAKWFHGTGSASYDRTAPIRQSSVIVESPDLQVPEIVLEGFTGEGPHAAVIDDNRVANILFSIATVEGVPCTDGPQFAFSQGRPTFGTRDNPQLTLCDFPIGTNARYDAASGGFANVLTSGDLVVTSTVEPIGGLGTTQTSDYRLHLSGTVCACAGRQDEYRVPLPGINAHYQPVPSIGNAIIAARWHRVGTSGVDQWTTIPQLEVLPAPAIGGPPQFNTDNRMTIDHTLTTSTSATAGLDLQADEDADYRVTLTSLDGSAPCLVSGGTGVATGHFTGSTAEHVTIPKLCFGSLYLATVSLTNSRGNTMWGARAGTHPWVGSLFATPSLAAHVHYSYTVTPPAGKVLTDLDLHVDGADIDPVNVLTNSCVNTPVTSTGFDSMQLTSHPVIHVHYRVRTKATGTACSAATTDTTMAVDRDVPIDLAAVEANPTGYRVTVGPVVLTITISPAT